MDGQHSPHSQVEAFLTAVHAQPFFGDENQEGSIRWYIAYYKDRAPKRRLAFRLSGFLLLVLSISLPFPHSNIKCTTSTNSLWGEYSAKFSRKCTTATTLGPIHP